MHVRVMRVLAPAVVAALLATPTLAFADNESDIPSDTPAPPGVGTPSGVTPTPAPVIVIRAYTTAPERVTVGAAFDLTLTLYNATGRRADNVVVSLGQSSGGAPGAGTTAPSGLAVLGTGNAKYLGTLKGQREGTVTFRVMAPPGTTPGALTVPVTVSFEHQDARQEVAYTIGVLVDRTAALSLVTAELPESVMAGESFDASFEVANSSAFALSGVTISVEADGATVMDGTAFVGTMDAASTEGIDVVVTPEKTGDLELAVVVTYRDDFGQPQEFRETRTVRVEETPEPSEGEPGAEVPEDEPRDNWFVAFIKALFGLGS